VGEWWSGEPQREIVRFIDERGIRREKVLNRQPVSRPKGDPKPYVEDNSEEVSLRMRKVRDEKVARACGYVPEDPLESSRFDEREPTYSDAEFLESMRAARERRYSGSAAEAKHIEAAKARSGRVISSSGRPYAPLHILSGYAFGRGTMLAEEIPVIAARMGLPAAAITDPHSLVGAVEFVKRSQTVGIKPLVGAEIELPEGGRIVLIARSKAGYQSLSQLVTECHLAEPRLHPLGSWERLQKFSRDLLCLTGGDDGPLDRLLIRGLYEEADRLVERLASLYGRSNLFIEIEKSFLPWENLVVSRLLELTERHGALPVAGGSATHARPEHFPAQDILVCVETLCTVEEVIGRKLTRDPTQPQAEPRPSRALNAERFLRYPHEMAFQFEGQEFLLDNTLRVVERCDDDVLPSRTQLPQIVPNPGSTLREAVWAGAARRHGRISPKLRNRLQHELDRIVGLNFAGHFLTIYDACDWAREQNILFSGRGSVVDSAVAYCLGISRIDAFSHNLHFDRFLPEDGSKRPDIDIDFEAKRRDDVRNYLTSKYGEKHVATVAAIGAYCTRGIIREVGKALGLPNDLIGYLSKRLHGGVTPDQLESALEKRPELMASGVPKERFRWVFDLAERLMDVPRNMRAHSSGVVISSSPLAETVPVMWSASEGSNAAETGLRIIQWDKRSAKYFFDKFDILCLRGQDVLSGVQQRINATTREEICAEHKEFATVVANEKMQRYGTLPPSSPSRSSGLCGDEEEFKVEQIPLDDPEAYRAMRSGELIGIPQSASPAMRQAHIRLRTQDLHDASLVQAGIRPGVGGAVKINELIARRRGKPYTFDHPELERILGLTYGIIVFQEQVDQLLQAFAGCSGGEAEDLRESIHKRRREDYGKMIREQIIQRILDNGFDRPIAEQVYEYVSGFKGYGFAQGHALAFAEISIRSIYCQQNFPAPYFASILSAQPAGYYGPCTLANEARSRGAKILHPDVNLSDIKFSVEDVRSQTDPKLVFPDSGIRVGLQQMHALSLETQRTILDARRFETFFEFAAKVRPSRDELETLVLCGALDSLCDNRRAMLWAIPKAQAYAEAIAARNGLGLRLTEPQLNLEIEDFTEVEKAIHERRYLDLDVEKHLMAFERERIRGKGGITSAEAKLLPNRHRAIVVGNPIRLRFPPTPSGKRVVFFDLEDETGLLNVTCFDAVYRRDGHAIVCSPYVTLIGEAQDRDGHTAFLAKRVFPYHPLISKLVGKAAVPIATADFLVG
jgi:error-prone DNA polymerase